LKPTDFAAKHFGEYRMQGDEIVPTYCPVCGGGRSQDKYTFALNTETLLYNCKRGSCGANGHYRHLLRDYGEVEQKSYEITSPTKKVFIPPQIQVQSPKEKVENYLKLRGISKDIWESWGVGEHKGAIAFPYYEEGKLVLMKFRKPEKYDGQGQKAWREPGGKAVFWGMDRCRPDKPLIIVEGEFDALALSECGLLNVVSVPSGAEDLTCIDHCWDWLQQFSQIVIWPDQDTPGQEMCRKLINKLGAWRCSVVKCEHKDANAALHRVGPEGVLECYENATEVPIAGLIRLSEVQAFDLNAALRIKSSVGAVNKHLQGYMGGQVTVITGTNGSGKSTFAGQEALFAVDQGYSVCAYSGELPAPVFRYWIDLQAAGPDFVEHHTDPYTGVRIWRVKSDYTDLIRAWYSDKFFLFDAFGDNNDDKNLLEVFSYAARRYDCKVFLLDNLMATAIQSTERDHLRQQADFVRQLKHFARTHDVHVMLVAHPRKTDGKLTKLDVAGAGEITNWADNVYAVSRPNDDDSEYAGYIDIFKSRWTGCQHKTIGMAFDDRTKRFMASKEYVEMLNYKYGWTKGLSQ
jgi:twinkle protein